MPRAWAWGSASAVGMSLTGLQGTMVNEANAFNAETVGDTRAMAAQTDITKAFNDAQQADARRLAGMGVLPGSGRYQALNNARAVDQARAGVGAANEARLGARNEGRALVDRAAGALAAYPSAASAQTVLGANLGAGQVNTANAGAAGINSNYSALTGAQQAASGVASQLGGNATSMYGAQTSRDTAQAISQNAANENLYAGIGSLLGGATKWLNTKQP